MSVTLYVTFISLYVDVQDGISAAQVSQQIWLALN